MANARIQLERAMQSIDLTDSCWVRELPQLPVPDLWISVSRYLASLKALLAPDSKSVDGSDEDNQRDEQAALAGDADQDNIEDEAIVKVQKGFSLNQNEAINKDQKLANRRQFARTSKIAHDFMLLEGSQLQRDLKEYASMRQNWATEYWLQDMYLSNPLPLPVNSNPFFLFPKQHFATSNQMLMFATRLIQFSVDFKYRIDQQTLRQDYGSGHGSGKPLCMETYRNFFHSYRMPHDQMDRLLPQSRRSNHIVVASCNQFYILRLGQEPLDDPFNKDAGSQLNSTVIFDQLLRIYRVSRERTRRTMIKRSSDTNNNNSNDKSNSDLLSGCPKVGLFTTENRKVWAKLHKKLLHCNPSSTSSACQDNQKNTNDNDTKVASNYVQQQNYTNSKNTDSLRLIEDCLFVMCLDSLVILPGVHKQRIKSNNELNESNVKQHQDQHQHQHQPTTADEQWTLEKGAINILTGGGSHLFSANRWFDKFLQIIVGRDGTCGINIEHSASEGITVLRFIEEFLEFVKLNPINNSMESSKSSWSSFCQNNNNNQVARINQHSITSQHYHEPKSPHSLLADCEQITPLSWELDDSLKIALNKAEINLDKLINNFSLHILSFNQFGRDFIKSQNLSPDAFIQLALQCAFYKCHGHLVSTYESASLRQFKFGRVDNIRANTCEAYDWILSMLKYFDLLDNRAKYSNQADLQQTINRLKQQCNFNFIRAITKQVEILRYTIIGGGPDNHLMVLKQLARIRFDNDDMPQFFTDKSYQDFLNFRLSTSQLPNESGVTVGYGAVVPDGYGCSYNPCPNKLIFCVSSFHDCELTSSSKFANYLEETLIQMKILCLNRISTST